MKVRERGEAEAAPTARAAALLYEAGKLNLKEGRHVDAIILFREAADSAKAAKSIALAERSLFELGRACAEMGYYMLTINNKLAAICYFKESLEALEECSRLGSVYPFQSAVLANSIRKTLKGLGARGKEEPRTEPAGTSRTALALQVIPVHYWDTGGREDAGRSLNAALFALFADYDTKEAQINGLRNAVSSFEIVGRDAEGSAKRASAQGGEGLARAQLARAAAQAGEGLAFALLGFFDEGQRLRYFREAHQKFAFAFELDLLSEKSVRKAMKTRFFRPSPEELERAAMAFVALGDFKHAEKSLVRASHLWFERGEAILGAGLSNYATITQAVDAANLCFIRCQKEELAAVAAFYEGNLFPRFDLSSLSFATVRLDMALGLFKLNAWRGMKEAYKHLRGEYVNHCEVMRRLERSGSLTLAYPLLFDYLGGGKEEAEMAHGILVKSAPVSVQFLLAAAASGGVSGERAAKALREVLRARTCLAEQVEDIKEVLEKYPERD